MLSSSQINSSSSDDHGAALDRRIAAAFDAAPLDAPVAAALRALCRSFSLAPAALFYKWEALSLRLPGAPAVPSLAHVADLRATLVRDQERMIAQSTSQSQSISSDHLSLDRSALGALVQSQRSALLSLPPSLPSARSGKQRIVPSSAANNHHQQQQQHLQQTPVTPNAKSSAARRGALDAFSSPPFGGSAFSPPVPISQQSHLSSLAASPSPLTIKFADRLNRAKAEELFSGTGESAGGVSIVPVPPSVPVSCELSLVPGQQTRGYRYMYEKLTEKGELLDARIDFFTAIIARHYLDRVVIPARAASASIGHANLSQSQSQPDDSDTPADASDIDPLSLVCNPSQPRQEPGLVIGRICCDSLVDGTRLNEQSVMIEPSRSVGGGTRVRVNLERLVASGKGVALFPGQIVGLVAANPSGRLLEVSSIIHPPLPPVPTTNLSEIASMYPAENGAQERPIHVVVAAGPFTLDDSLAFEPLEALVTDVVEADPPDVVVLLGPFVSIDHPRIVAGEVDADLDDMFRDQIASRIERMRAARPGLKIVLVPSTRDACTEWIAFPQPPLAAGLTPAEALQRRSDLGLLSSVVKNTTSSSSNDILLFPNPVQFRLNEIVFAVSSTDALFDLGTLECARASAASATANCDLSGATLSQKNAGSSDAPVPEALDRISRGFLHLVQQRSFYPVFPPTTGVCLDATRALAITMPSETANDTNGAATVTTALDDKNPTENNNNNNNNNNADDDGDPGPLVLQVVPDVLIVSSKLRYAARAVGSTLCINPGVVAKGRAGGTYARLCIHPFNLGSSRRRSDNPTSTTSGDAGVSKTDAVDGDRQPMQTDEDDVVLAHAVAQRSAVVIRRI